ncbi:hypothetical protein [Rhizobium esperanzae]|uniref:Uncharacterized protein n=1 Tax=Rhizobium esperanzae TaxID=1967781 RepID=A0A7W6R2K4_9HYPH|nr:hypothetical protein [Rhizobium esperanzae]MBB4235524.1 hypothetical protein [Rhizobium esperanzae]
MSAIETMAKVCSDRYEQFGATGHAFAIKPLPLVEMAKRCRC